MMGSKLGPNFVKAKKSDMRDINSMSNGNDLASNRLNSLPLTVRSYRQKSCNQRFGCRLCISVVRIYEDDRTWYMRTVRRSGPLLWSGWVLSSYILLIYYKLSFSLIR